MKIKLSKLKTMIRESMSLSWDEWLDELEIAMQDAGYDSQSDLPAYDFVSSDDERIDDGIQKMYDNGLSPSQAISELEDRDEFWSKWAIE